MGKLEIIRAERFTGLRNIEHVEGFEPLRGDLSSPVSMRGFVPTPEGRLWLPPGATSYGTTITSPDGGRTLTDVVAMAPLDWGIFGSSGFWVQINQYWYWFKDQSSLASPVYVETAPGAGQFQHVGGMVFDSSLGASGEWAFLVTDGTNASYWRDSGGGVITSTPSLYAANQCGHTGLWYQSRWWMGNLNGHVNRVVYSDVNRPTIIGATSAFDFVSPRGISDIRCLKPWQDSLAIFTRRDMWLLRGNDITNFYQERQNGDIGADGHYAVTEYSGGLLFFSSTVGQEGLWWFGGGAPELRSKNLGRLIRTAARGRAWNWTDIYASAMWSNLTVWEDRAILNIGTPSGGSYQGYTYVLDLESGDEDWAVLDGFNSGTTYGRPFAMVADLGKRPALIQTKGLAIYYTQGALMRLHGSTTATVSFGYTDPERNQFFRFQRCKINLWKVGSGSPTAVVTFTTESGDTITTSSYTVSATNQDDGWIDIPVNLRGRSLKIDVTVTPSSSSNEVWIEDLELWVSGKLTKVSR